MGKSISLFSAYACDADTPSEPIAGHAFLVATINNLKEDDVLHVISRSILKQRILSSVGVMNRRNVYFHFVGIPKIFSFLEKPGIGIKARFGYLAWNHYAKKYLRKQPWINSLKLAHHVTLSSDILPTLLTSIPNTTFKVWGPVGSTGNYLVFLLPPYSARNILEALKQLVRNFISHITGRHFSRQSDLVLAQTLRTEKKFQSLGVRSSYFPNQFIPNYNTLTTYSRANQETHASSNLRSSASTVKVLIVGHFVAGKRVDMGIELMKRTKSNRLSLTVIGSKPQPSNRFLQSINFVQRKRTLPANTFLLGKLDRLGTMKTMVEMDVLLHLSGREGPSFVVGEAISMGIPVVCFEGTGAADTVRSVPGCGLVIPATKIALNNLESYILQASLLRSEGREIWNLRRIEDFLSTINKEIS
jgi:glycosyltransferase involved in cell wall biosynthesis